MSSPQSTDALLDQALLHHEAGRLDLAETTYRAVLAVEPDEPDALNLLGLLRQIQGDNAQGVALIRRAVELVPDFPEAWTNLARGYRAMGDVTLALEAARQAISLDPTLAEAHYQLGCALAQTNDDAAAQAALEQAVALDADSIEAMAQLGAVLLRRQQYEPAIQRFRAVLSRRPGDTAAMINLGLALAGAGQVPEALVWHERVTSLADGDVAGHAALAATRRLAHDPVGSMQSCHRALALAPERADMWSLLGSNLATLGRFDEAEAAYRSALEYAPGSVEILRDMAQIRNAGTDSGGQAQAFRAVLADMTADAPKRIAAGFGLARVMDKAGDTATAFAAVHGANRLMREQTVAAGKGYDAAGSSRYVDWAIETFQPGLFASVGDWGDRSGLPVFIVGMPRSGTTLVEQIIASHPTVFGAGELRDVQEIVSGLQGTLGHRSPLEWDQGQVAAAARQHVAHLLQLGGAAERVVDKLPDNAFALGQIAVLFPNARVIICQRDPRDVALSCYFQQFSGNLNWAYDLTEIAARIHDHERIMAHWRKVLPLRMLEVRYEALVEDLEAESRRLIDFLGLEWDPACLAFHENARPVMTASFWQVRQQIYGSSVGRWRAYRKYLGPLLAGLADLAPLEGAEDNEAVADSWQVSLTLAIAHHKAGRVAAAASIYRALHGRNPNDPVVMHLLGLALTDLGRPVDAVSLIRRSVAQRPTFAPAFADLARAQRLSNDPVGAVESARHAVTLDPKLADGWAQLGYALTVQAAYDEATQALAKATTLAPGSLEAWVGLGSAMTFRKDYSACVEIWEKCLALSPDEPSLRSDYASALAEVRRISEAIAIYRETIERSPLHVPSHLGLARALQRTGDGKGAQAAAARAVELEPENCKALTALGEAWVMIGQFDRAAEMFQRALALDPFDTEAITGLTWVSQQSVAPGVLASAQAILQDDSRPPSDRIAAGYALGRDLDKNGEFDAAFAAYAAANHLQRLDRERRGSSVDPAAFSRQVDSQIRTFTPDVFRASAHLGTASELPVFIVGLPRSGTTLVEQIVASHPLVYGSGEREDMLDTIRLISDDCKIPPPAWDPVVTRREALAHLERLRSVAGGAVRVVDKLPSNIDWVGQIRILYPQARIIWCRRDLRDVCLSCHFQKFNADALAWCNDLADCGLYARETERLGGWWRNVLPSPMLEVQYETLVGDLEAESRRLIDFLGLAWDPACLAFHETERTVVTASTWQVRQPLYSSSVGRWRHYQRHLTPLLQALGPLPGD